MSQDPPRAPELEQLLADVVEKRLGTSCVDVLAYELWTWMSRNGHIEIDDLNLIQREVVDRMLAAGLVWLQGNRVVQAPAAVEIDRWAGL